MPKAEADIRVSLDPVVDDTASDQRIYGHIGEVARATRDLVDTVEHRFEQVDERFATVDQRFEQVDRRFDQVERRFEQVDQRFEQVDQRFDRVDQRFDKVEKQLGLVVDEVRVTGARVEELVKYIVRDELKGSAPVDG